MGDKGMKPVAVNRQVYKNQPSDVFIGQNVENELYARISEIPNIDAYKHDITMKVLVSSSERTMFVFYNLVRVAPMHCANTICELARIHYTRHDPSKRYEVNEYGQDDFSKLLFYQEFMNLKFNVVNENVKEEEVLPQVIKTLEGVAAVDSLR